MNAPGRTSAMTERVPKAVPFGTRAGLMLALLAASAAFAQSTGHNSSGTTSQGATSNTQTQRGVNSGGSGNNRNEAPSSSARGTESGNEIGTEPRSQRPVEGGTVQGAGASGSTTRHPESAIDGRAGAQTGSSVPGSATTGTFGSSGAGKGGDAGRRSDVPPQMPTQHPR